MVTFEFIPALRPRGGQSGLEKRRDESFFFFFRKSPWVPTLTGQFQTGQANTGS